MPDEYDIDQGAGDSLRQNKLDTWRPMLGTNRPDPLDPYGGYLSPGIIFAEVDAAPLDELESIDPSIARLQAPIRFARKGTDTKAKKGDVKLSYDLSESQPSAYYDLLDVDNQFPEAQDWRNIHWSPDFTGAEPREPRAPLPIPMNAQLLGASTPGELAALALRRVPRIWFTTWNEQWWQDYDVDGRHVIFPRQNYPIGDGPVAPQSFMQSVQGNVPPPITSELGDVPMSNTEDYSSLVGA